MAYYCKYVNLIFKYVADITLLLVEFHKHFLEIVIL